MTFFFFFFNMFVLASSNVSLQRLLLQVERLRGGCRSLRAAGLWGAFRVSLKLMLTRPHLLVLLVLLVLLCSHQVYSRGCVSRVNLLVSLWYV